MQESPKKLNWTDVQEFAKEMFNIWVDQPALRWAESAWLKLESQRLTEYSNVLEEYVVLVRLMTLATLYHDFCEYAFDISSSIDYYLWLDYLEQEGFPLHPLRMGQLLGRGFMSHEKIEKDPKVDLVKEGICALVESERSPVVNALINGFGNESLVFANLWQSRQSTNSSESNLEEDFSGHHETIDDVLGDMTFEKMKAFEWIAEGMPGKMDYSLDDDSDSVEQLIKEGETEKVEFKVGACLNPKSNNKDSCMTDKIAIAVASFINTEGGKVFIGVDDDGNIVGIEREYGIANPQKNNKDGYLLFLQDALRSKLKYGLSHLSFKARIYKVRGKEVCRIEVSKAKNNDFAYFQDKVYIRQGNQSLEINGRQLVEHLKNLGRLLS
jgi:hypothetical protein